MRSKKVSIERIESNIKILRKLGLTDEQITDRFKRIKRINFPTYSLDMQAYKIRKSKGLSDYEIYLRFKQLGKLHKPVKIYKPMRQYSLIDLSQNPDVKEFERVIYNYNQNINRLKRQRKFEASEKLNEEKNKIIDKNLKQLRRLKKIKTISECLPDVWKKWQETGILTLSSMQRSDLADCAGCKNRSAIQIITKSSIIYKKGDIICLANKKINKIS